MIRATDTLDGLKKLYEANPDLVILARGLPMVNREDPCLRIRQASYLPLLILGSDDEAAEMLELGADAYMAKPLSLHELVARVHALLRRKPKYGPPGSSRKLEISHRLPRAEQKAEGLTRTEFRLASCLILNKDRLLGYPRLISEVWGGKEVSLDTLHFYVRRLRSKLGNIGIWGLRGIGYCLSGEGNQAPR